MKPRNSLTAKAPRQKYIATIAHQLVSTKRGIDHDDVWTKHNQLPYIDEQIGEQTEQGWNTRPFAVAGIAHLRGPIGMQTFIVERYATRQMGRWCYD